MTCYCISHANENDLYRDLVAQNKFTLTKFEKGDYEETAFLTCTSCGQKWKYHFTDSYHYPIVTWSKK